MRLVGGFTMKWLAPLLAVALFVIVEREAAADGWWQPAQPNTTLCTTTREDVISLIGYFNDDVYGRDADPVYRAYVKQSIYYTVQRESGTNQCRPDGSYVLGDRYLNGRGYHSVGFAQLHDGYDDSGRYIGSAWHNARNPYRHLGLAGRYDAEVQAAFITWYAWTFKNLGPWCTPHVESWMCGP